MPMFSKAKRTKFFIKDFKRAGYYYRKGELIREEKSGRFHAKIINGTIYLHYDHFKRLKNGYILHEMQHRPFAMKREILRIKKIRELFKL